jgi:hypothetical protein
MTEKAWEGQVVGLARFYGWTGWHHADSRRQVTRRGVPTYIGDPDAKGFPDWVFVRGPELLFVELKGEHTRVTPEQTACLDALRVVADHVDSLKDAILSGVVEPVAEVLAVEVHLWRAPDLDPVHERLARGRTRQEPVGG